MQFSIRKLHFIISKNCKFKYIFQILPSQKEEQPYLFYIQTINNLISINSTDEEDCKLVRREIIDENLFHNISSVSLMDTHYLVKTCFGPDNIVEIQIKKNETFFYKKNNMANIKYCYSSKIINPTFSKTNPDIYVIVTYWTEISSITDREKYSHKYILFYPVSKTFSQEFIVTGQSQLFINLYYPEKCVTFRYKDIYCGIHFNKNDDSNYILGYNYVIETRDQTVYLVVSNSKLDFTSYQVPVPSGIIEKNQDLENLDLFLTQINTYEENGPGKTSLLYSYYRNKLHRSYIPYYENSNKYYINIEDNYVNPNLLNYLVPNDEELIILYISKEAKMSLLLTRFNTREIISKIKTTSINNPLPNSYIRTDICDQPKYFQSLYINSFISSLIF